MAAVPSIGRADAGREAVPSPQAAAALMYERYRPQLERYCRSRLRSQEEAEDAVQATFLRALSALQRGVRPEVEPAWLFKIAHNVCLSRQLSSTRRGRVEAPRDLDALQDEVAAPAAGADELFALDDVLADMPERLRTAFLLREWQGLSYEEIANELGVSRSAVETLIFRARRHLASALDNPFSKLRRRVRHALDSLGLLPALKALFAGGAAKLAVAGAGAVATAVAVGAAAGVAVPLRGAGDERRSSALGAAALVFDGTRAGGVARAGSPGSRAVGVWRYAAAPARGAGGVVAGVAADVAAAAPAGAPASGPAAGPGVGAGSPAPGPSSGRAADAVTSVVAVAPKAPPVSAPSVPSTPLDSVVAVTPSVPSTPSVPEIPSVPSTPAVPSAPPTSVPTPTTPSVTAPAVPQPPAVEVPPAPVAVQPPPVAVETPMLPAAPPTLP